MREEVAIKKFNTELFETAFGTAILVNGEEKTAVRVVLDTENNELVCSLPHDLRNPYSLFRKTVELQDVKLYGNGVDWYANKISGLKVKSSGGATFNVNHSVPGAVASHFSSKEIVKFFCNSKITFSLSVDLGYHWEFAGGYDFGLPIKIKDRTFLRSNGKLTWLSGPDKCKLELRELLTVIGLCVGYPVKPRFHISGLSLDFFWGQKKSDEIGKPFFNLTANTHFRKKTVDTVLPIERPDLADKSLPVIFWRISDVIQKIEDSNQFCNQIQLFLYAQIMKGLTENRVMSLFQFIEAIDDENKMNKKSISNLLQISEQSAQKFINVRHQVAHATMTLDEAVNKFIDFSSTDFASYAYTLDRNIKFLDSLNFLGFISSKANEIVSSKIGFSGKARNEFGRL